MSSEELMKNAKGKRMESAVIDMMLAAAPCPSDRGRTHYQIFETAIATSATMAS